MLQQTAVGPVPVRLNPGAKLVTIENLGERPLRFVVGEAAAETAPAGLEAGHLLQSGQREIVRLGDAAYPIWAWSDFPTQVGLSPPLAG